MSTELEQELQASRDEVSRLKAELKQVHETLGATIGYWGACAAEIEELQRVLEAYENAQPLTAAFVVGRPSRDALATDDDNGAAVERWRYL